MVSRVLAKAVCQNPQASIFASKVMLYDQPETRTTGDQMGADGLPANRGKCGSETQANTTRRKRCLAAAGAARHGASWEALGGLDEDFWMYLDDVDFAFRAHLLGESAVFVPDARILHRLTATAGGMASYCVGRNTIWTIAKNMPPTSAAQRRHRRRPTRHRGWMRCATRTGGSAPLRGQIVGILTLWRILAKRRAVQARRIWMIVGKKNTPQIIVRNVMQTPREQLGSFFIGGEYDLHSGETSETPLVYDARDLTTHAVCVGMTGSGKTGLCIDILEEAALDHVPALIVDPKGDITNLLLQFPEMRPEDFLPWINVDDARRKGQTVEEYAAATAENWRKGLDGWGIGAERLRELQQSADFTIYTPGSDAGIPISVLGSLAAPNIDFGVDGELARNWITGHSCCASGADRRQVRTPSATGKACCWANIFEHYWRAGEDLDLANWILSSRTRRSSNWASSMSTRTILKKTALPWQALNSLVASPSFSAWLEGEPLDVGRLLFTADGEPRHSIFYLAHLSDAERMFFVTLLLENTLTWMRKQSGTTSLRACSTSTRYWLFRQTAEPPSKRPLLTLMKQAPSGWAASWSRKTRSMWITRAWRMRGRGSSAKCRLSEIRIGCCTGCRTLSRMPAWQGRANRLQRRWINRLDSRGS